MHAGTNGRTIAGRPRGMLLAVAVAGALSLAGHAAAQCETRPRDRGFESQTRTRVTSPWIQEGTAGIDVGTGFSHDGSNNAWARARTGWNAVRQRVELAAGVTYTLRGFVRTSGNVRDGYFGFRDSAQRPVSETRFGALPGYSELRVSFRPAVAGTYNIFTGFWAPNQDAWIQMDDFRLDGGGCNDVILNPVDG